MPKKGINECGECKIELTNILNKNSKNNRLYHSLSDHIKRKFINKRRRLKDLQLAKETLDHILKRDEKKLKVSDFKKSYKAIHSFLKEGPNVSNNDNNDNNEMYCVLHTTKKGNNNMLYNYEISFFAKGLDTSLIGKQFILNHLVFNTDSYTFKNRLNESERDKYKEHSYDISENSINKRIYNDHVAWQRLIESISNNQSLSNLLNLLSSTVIIKVANVVPKGATSDQVENFQERQIADFINEKYIDTKYIKYHIDVNSPFLIQSIENINTISLKQSCFYKVIYNTYKESFDKYHRKLRKDKRLILNEHMFCRLCTNKEYIHGDELNYRVFEIEKFFHKFQLGLRIFDKKGNSLYKYIPKTFHTKIRPRILDVIYNNNHVTQITDTKSFEQLLLQKKDNDLFVSNKYVFKNYSLQDAEYILASTFEEIIEKIKFAHNKIHVVWKGYNLNDLLLKFVKNGYTPSIQIGNGFCIKSISFNNLIHNEKSIKLYISIIPVSQGDDEAIDDSITMDTYKKYKELEALVFDILINDKLLSSFNKNTKDIFDEYAVNIPIGATYNITDILNNVSVIDMYKHYASCLAKSTYLVSISPFENFVAVYNNNIEITKDKLYIVDILETCTIPIYKMKDRTLMYYEEIIDLVIGKDISICGYINIILHENKVLPTLIQEIFDNNGIYNEIPIELRKGLINRAIGE